MSRNNNEAKIRHRGHMLIKRPERLIMAAVLKDIDGTTTNI